MARQPRHRLARRWADVEQSPEGHEPTRFVRPGQRLYQKRCRLFAVRR